MSATKTNKKTTTSKKTPVKATKPMRREVSAFAFLFLGIFMILSWSKPEGAFIVLISQLFGGLLGAGIYVAAFCYIILAIRLFFHRGQPITMCVVTSNIMPVIAAAVIHLNSNPPDFSKAETMEAATRLWDLGLEFKHGGALGGLLADFLTAALGPIATNIILFFVIAACVLIFLNTNVYELADKAKNIKLPKYSPELFPENEQKKEQTKQDNIKKEAPKKEPKTKKNTSDVVSNQQNNITQKNKSAKITDATKKSAADLPIGNYKGDALYVMGQENKSAQKRVLDIPMSENSVDLKNKPKEKTELKEQIGSSSTDSLTPLSDVIQNKSKTRTLEPMKMPSGLSSKTSGRKTVVSDTNKSQDKDKPNEKALENIKPISDKELEELFGIKADSPKNTKENKKSLSSEELSKEIKEVSEEIGRREKEKKSCEYQFPPISLLNQSSGSKGSKDYITINRDRLCQALESFGIAPNITDTINGPTVTRYDICLESGTKLSKITNLSGDLALALGVVSVRIAPVPEKYSTVGIEVPNKVTDTVYLRDVIDSDNFKNAASKISFAVGKDISGKCVVGNIGKLPHLLIAGTTGSGKSVCMNSLILSILYKATPDEVKFIMVDPKMVELGIYNDIPHLFAPVVTDPKKAAGALQWSVVEMLKRYRLFSEIGVRDLATYNRHCANNGEETLPQIVIVIDELADLMIAAAKDVEESICRIAQMGRAAGMHLVIATQRPSAEVITGLMKANIPSRIAFAVSSSLESRIILDQVGAEKLIGMGDMLYAPLGGGKPNRVQGTFVTDEEREGVISFIKSQVGERTVNSELVEAMENKANESNEKGKGKEKDSDDEIGTDLAGDYDKMLPEAVRVSIDMKKISVSNLQRRVKLGYSRAARIMDQMEELGVVGPYNGAKPRDVIITLEQWAELATKIGFKVDISEFADSRPEEVEYEE